MKNVIATVVMATSLVLVGTANALTLKSGQVLSSDGNVYDGASPEQKANIIANANKTDFWGNEGKKAGVTGSNLFVVVEDDVVFIPVKEMAGKSKDDIKDLVKERIISHLTADLRAYYTDGVDGFDKEAFDQHDLTNDPIVKDMMAEHAEAVKNAGQAAADDLLNAQLALAVVDATDDAARIAAEKAVEAAYEAAAPAAERAINAAAEAAEAAAEAAGVALDDAVYDSDGNFVGSFQDMCNAGEISDC